MWLGKPFWGPSHPAGGAHCALQPGGRQRLRRGSSTRLGTHSRPGCLGGRPLAGAPTSAQVGPPRQQRQQQVAARRLPGRAQLRARLHESRRPRRPSPAPNSAGVQAGPGGSEPSDSGAAGRCARGRPGGPEARGAQRAGAGRGPGRGRGRGHAPGVTADGAGLARGSRGNLQCPGRGRARRSGRVAGAGPSPQPPRPGVEGGSPVRAGREGWGVPGTGAGSARLLPRPRGPPQRLAPQSS